MSKIVELKRSDIEDVVGGVSVVINRSSQHQPAPPSMPNGQNAPSLPAPNTTSHAPSRRA